MNSNTASLRGLYLLPLLLANRSCALELCLVADPCFHLILPIAILHVPLSGSDRRL